MHVPDERVIRPHADGPHAVWVASATIPTRHGEFQTHVFRSRRGDGPSPGEASAGEVLEQDQVALVYGEVTGKAAVPVRVHSECLTSEVFGSLKCDCREQLEAAMAEVARRGAGVILYLRQEGRGIGLANKIRAYSLQAHGHDTVDANRLLGLPDDARTYEVVPDMLAHLGVKSVRLLTNNPAKVLALRSLGVDVVGRQPVIVEPTRHSAGYLEAKRLRMAHELPVPLRAASNDAE